MKQYFYVKPDGWCQISLDGVNYYTSPRPEWVELNTPQFDVANCFWEFNSSGHIQMVLDAGGEKLAGGAARVEMGLAIAFCRKLEALRDPHAGMMVTSTGEWVDADDWDQIEGDC